MRMPGLEQRRVKHHDTLVDPCFMAFLGKGATGANHLLECGIDRQGIGMFFHGPCKATRNIERFKRQHAALFGAEPVKLRVVFGERHREITVGIGSKQHIRG